MFLLSDPNNDIGGGGDGTIVSPAPDSSSSSSDSLLPIIVSATVGGALLVALAAVLIALRLRKTRLPAANTRQNFDYVNPNASVWDTNVQVQCMSPPCLVIA